MSTLMDPDDRATYYKKEATQHPFSCSLRVIALLCSPPLQRRGKICYCVDCELDFKRMVKRTKAQNE